MKIVALTLPFLILSSAGHCAEQVRLTCPTHEDLSVDAGDWENGQTKISFTGTLKEADLTLSGTQSLAAKDPSLTKSFPVASLVRNNFNCHLLFNYTTPNSKTEQSTAVVMSVNLPAEYKNCKLEGDGSDSIVCDVG